MNPKLYDPIWGEYPYLLPGPITQILTCKFQLINLPSYDLFTKSWDCFFTKIILN